MHLGFHDLGEMIRIWFVEENARADLEGFRTFRVWSERDGRDAQDARFFLDAARIREDEFRCALQTKEVQVPNGIYRKKPRAKRDVVRVNDVPRARMDWENEEEVIAVRRVIDGIQHGTETLRIIHISRTVHRK
jgi:hypothetical protein